MFPSNAIAKLEEFDYGFLLSFFNSLPSNAFVKVSTECRHVGDFLNCLFISKDNECCRFEVGLKLHINRRVNLFIGEFGGAILQYEEVNDLEDQEAIIAAFEAFFESEVFEKKTFCGAKIKEVTYQCSEIVYENSRSMLSYKPISRPVFFCLKRMIEERQYMPWVNLKSIK